MKADGTATRNDIRRAAIVLEQLPDLLVARRYKLGHPTRAAAEHIGIAYPRLSAIETGKAHPSFETLQALLVYLTERPPP